MEAITSNTSSPAPRQAREAPAIVWREPPIGSAVVVFESEPLWKMAAASGRRLGLEQVIYSIRLPDRIGEVRCARCGTRFRAAGPTGHADELPICDLCLLECEEELGMVLALISVVRAYASMPYGSAREHWEALEEVGAFSHIFERVAMTRSGSGRIFRPDLERGS